MEAPQEATEQNPSLYGVSETPVSWEERLSPSSLSWGNLEGVTGKVGTLGLQSFRNNRSGIAKKIYSVPSTGLHTGTFYKEL